MLNAFVVPRTFFTYYTPTKLKNVPAADPAAMQSALSCRPRIRVMHLNGPILMCDCSNHEETIREGMDGAESGMRHEGMMYDFNFRRTLVQKPMVLTGCLCGGIFCPGHGYTIYILYYSIRIRGNNMQDCFFFLKIYSSITFRVSAPSF